MTASSLYTRNDSWTTDAGLGLCAVWPCSGEAPVLVSSEVARRVRACDGLKPLDEHLRSLIAPSAAPAFQWSRPETWAPATMGHAELAVASASMRALLDDAVRHGLLISDAQIAAALSHAGTPRRLRPRLSRVAVMTRDRPRLLRRCLDTLLAARARHAHSVPYVVFDDSRPRATCDENRAVLRTLQERHGVSITYMGTRETSELQALLSETAEVAPDLVGFALFGDPETGESYGANRNRLLLSTVGERIVTLDDDTQAVLHGDPAPRGWAVEAGDPTEFWFFRDRQAAFSLLPPLDADVVEMNEGIVGADVSSLAATPGPALLPSRSLPPWLLQRLLRPRARVAYSMLGLAGDCAAWGPHYVSLTGSSRERLVADEAGYAWARSTREIIRCAQRATLTPPSLFMAYAAGLDNAELLPPFLPLHRNSDGIFALTLALMDPGAFGAALPCAIRHDPEQARSFSTDIASVLFTFRFSEVVGAALRTTSLPATPVPTCRRLAVIGEHLCELGRAPLLEFEEVIRRSIQVHCAALAQRLDDLRRQFGDSPRYWATDARRALRGLHGVLTSTAPVVPVDVKAGHPLDVRRQAVQTTIARFGELLLAWPALCNAARTLVTAAQRPASEVESR